MTDDANIENNESEDSEVTLVKMAEFLESWPPNQTKNIEDVARDIKNPSGPIRTVLATPELLMHCSNDACNGPRFYRCISNAQSISKDWSNYYVGYRCSNCQWSTKTFALKARHDRVEKAGQAHKFGELPTFGPPTPGRLISLIGPDRELFLQGRRCENQGMGIGAFVYYRRVVEDQKSRIISKIISVAEKLGLDEAALKELHDAKEETQFSKALGSVKHGIPQALLINGHNPLLLLHNALSDGVHARTDSECLEIAGYVRLVLIDLAERLSQAMKDEAELNNAVSKLAAIKQKSQQHVAGDV